MSKRITIIAIIAIALFLCIPSFAQHFLGAFAGSALHLDTQIESPAQNNNTQTLPEQQTGRYDTISAFRAFRWRTCNQWLYGGTRPAGQDLFQLYQ